MSDLVRSLGLEYGSYTVHQTTFNDEGVLPPSSPLRRAWAHWEPTMMGLLAGSLRLLRDPYVVLSLGSSLGRRTLVDHLLGLYSTQLAAIFGDRETFDSVRAILAVAHRRRFLGKDQPDWFIETIGGRHEFTVGEPRLKRAVAAAITACVVRAHMHTGVLIDGHDGTTYVHDTDRTIGWVNGVALLDPDNPDDTTPRALLQLGHSYPDVPLMDRDLLSAAGVPQLLADVLSTEVAPGITIGAFSNQIVGCMYPADRDALGLNFTATSEERFQLWGDDYAEKASRARAQGVIPDAEPGIADLTEGSFFRVAKGRFVI